MKNRSVNYILLIVVIVLAFNLIFPIKSVYGKFSFGDLKCEINGVLIEDINLCCHEMARFPTCFNNECNSSNYHIISNKQTFRYCKARGYDVRN